MKRINTTPKLVCAMLFAAFGAAGNAEALLFATSDGTAQSFSWSYTGTTYTMTGTGSIAIDVANSSTSFLLLNVTLDDNSVVPDGGTSKDIRLTSFGFGINPEATGVTLLDAADGGMVAATLDDIPSLKLIEICAYGGQNCSGGSNDGIWAGGLDTFQLKLAGTWEDSVTIDPIGFKYQTKEGSYEFYSSSTGGPPATGPVPEPGTITLLGAGILGALFYRRRAQRRA